MRAGTTQFGSFVEQIPLFGQCYLKFLEITRGAQSQSRTISGSFDCSHDSPFDLIICASILECPYILGKLRLTFPSMIEWCLMGVVSGLESIPCGPYVILRGIFGCYLRLIDYILGQTGSIQGAIILPTVACLPIGLVIFLCSEDALVMGLEDVFNIWHATVGQFHCRPIKNPS